MGNSSGDTAQPAPESSQKLLPTSAVQLATGALGQTLGKVKLGKGLFDNSIILDSACQIPLCTRTISSVSYSKKFQTISENTIPEITTVLRA